MNLLDYLFRSAMMPIEVIAGVAAIVIALNPKRPQPRWVAVCLLVFGLASVSTGLLGYLLASGRLGEFLPGHRWAWDRHRTFLQGVCVGTLLVLVFARPFSCRKSPEDKNVS